MTRADRRETILDAAVALLAEHGQGGLTHRATDARARLPQGSTSYYYPKKIALLLAAADHLALQLAADCDDLQVGFADRTARQGIDAAVTYVAEEMASYADSARPLFLARIELTLAAARDPALAAIGPRLTEAARRPIAFFLALISEGRTDAPTKADIETCAALIDGITLMHVTGQGPKPTADQVRAVFAALL